MRLAIDNYRQITQNSQNIDEFLTELQSLVDLIVENSKSEHIATVINQLKE